MKRFLLSSFLISAVVFTVTSQVDLSYYLPTGVEYNSDIPTPREIIGHEVGEWHITHDRLVYYMKALAAASPRIEIEEIGQTHEGRPQLLLTITSTSNHQKLDQIQSEHLKLTDPNQSGSLDISSMPAVVWQGFSIHGNEPSGSNASMLTAYHYAAAQGDAIEEMLENLVILLDPSFNPDGLTRFATWANSRRSKNPVADPNSMELNESWLRGRTNHYWFDLNRDWLPVQQPEAQNRIRKYHEWKPNVLTDHHEMGSNSSFFFQPGIPSRNNPNTPENTFVLTEKIGTYHAKALDKIGSLYYTKESYDDFYYGKGSTFPDINGAVGILFEQASSRGHLHETDNGLLTFPFTIRNQFVTSLSTTEAAVALREELLSHQKEFFKTAKKEAAESNFSGIIFGTNNDPSRARELANIMIQHDIEVYKLPKFTTLNSTSYPVESSYIVPLDQYQYKLIDIMFESTTTFKDSLFYDVSAWTLPMAFNLNYEYLTSRQFASLGQGDAFTGKIQEIADIERSEYAYAFKWDDYYSPKLLWKLMDEGISCKVANKPFSTNTKSFGRGSVIISVQNQEMNSDEVYSKLNQIQKTSTIRIDPINSGTTRGINLGSRAVSKIDKPSIAVLVEEGVRSNDAGEVWHLLDNRFDIEATMLPIRVFNRTDLDRYNTIILVNGSYNAISSSAITKLKTWIEDGGNIIAYKGANSWLKQNEIISLETISKDTPESQRLTYSDLSNTQGAQATGGAIFSGYLDTSHPIGYGYSSQYLPVFVNGNTFYKAPKNNYSYPFQFKDQPLESGYISKENLKRLSKSVGVIVSKSGRGRIVSFSFNTNFRAFWYGTNKLLLNAIFYSDQIDSRSADD